MADLSLLVAVGSYCVAGLVPDHVGVAIAEDGSRWVIRIVRLKGLTNWLAAHVAVTILQGTLGVGPCGFRKASRWTVL